MGVNKHGCAAEHIIFRTTQRFKDGAGEPVGHYWHGTTFHCLHDILTVGMQDPWDKSIQDFTDVGIYVSARLTVGGALYHACPTRFVRNVAQAGRVPPTRIVLKVLCRGAPKKQRRYGDCTQAIFPAADVVVEELHFFRGVGFWPQGEHYFSCVGEVAEQWTLGRARVEWVDYDTLGAMDASMDPKIFKSPEEAGKRGAEEPADASGDIAALAETIAEESLPQRRRAENGELYAEEEFLDYSPQWGHWMWEQAVGESRNDATEDQWERLGTSLWHCRTSRRAHLEAGVWLRGAQEMPSRESIESIFRIVEHYRDMFCSSVGREGDALELTLDGCELGKAWALWRKDFETYGLYPHQAEMWWTDNQRYKSEIRSWFNAHVKKICGNTHVVKVLLTRGIKMMNLNSMGELLAAVRKEKANSGCGAREPAAGDEGAQAELRGAALRARQDFREGRRLYRKVTAGSGGSWNNRFYQSLSSWERQLVKKFESGALAKESDDANKAYGHGIARTSDYGFAVGENMHEGVSMARRLMCAIDSGERVTGSGVWALLEPSTQSVKT